MTSDNRATNKEILARLQHLLGTAVVKAVQETAAYYQSQNPTLALDALSVSDETIGGVQGVFSHWTNPIPTYDVEDRPVYRPLGFSLIAQRLQN